MVTGLGCQFHSVLSGPGSGVGSGASGPHGGDKLLEAGVGAHSFHPCGVELLLFLGGGSHFRVRVGADDGGQLLEGWDRPHLFTAGCSLGAVIISVVVGRSLSAGPEVRYHASEPVGADELVCLGLHGLDMPAVTELVLAAVVRGDYVRLSVVSDAGYPPLL